ncbi:hypothetical protein GXW83_31665 [Streptacidiphilus sp. PB12-B1b]|uniref:hypothetical protein n=1 Tax=Streptacidiphilus sp. PB12-B1b TaxID=2705012 RepID=UPI0015F89E39|nr:hypothetical protein [Streptacidiphilus sp. PB12-B1b]QMU79589.1 hypothetical protein GXW83_31665 [Streptacidiphilus sp. PB12-B1b]
MKQLARRLGRSLAFVLPVVLVTTGTLAVTRVPWAPSDNSGDQQQLAASASSQTGSGTAVGTSAGTGHSSPQDALRSRLLRELDAQNPGVALNSLQQAMEQQPSLTRYCTGIARDLGQAAVRKYRGDVRRAQSFARPVCDGSFAAGTMAGTG